LNPIAPSRYRRVRDSSRRKSMAEIFATALPVRDGEDQGSDCTIRREMARIRLKGDPHHGTRIQAATARCSLGSPGVLSLSEDRNEDAKHAEEVGEEVVFD